MKKGDVFVSPFIGRLDDIGENGMSLIENIIKMYKKGDGHVEILSASIRNMNHFMASLALKVDIVTVPFKILKEWAENGMPIPKDYSQDDFSALKEIPYQEIILNKKWMDFNIKHELTDKGIKRFTEDWNALIK